MGQRTIVDLVVTVSKERIIRLSVNVIREIQLAFLTGARSEGVQMPGDTRRVRDKARRRTLQYVEPFVRAERRRFG